MKGRIITQDELVALLKHETEVTLVFQDYQGHTVRRRKMVLEVRLDSIRLVDSESGELSSIVFDGDEEIRLTPLGFRICANNVETDYEWGHSSLLDRDPESET